MKLFFRLFLVLFFSLNLCIHAREFLYILDDECINDLHDKAVFYFKNTEVLIIRDTLGIVLRFEINNPHEEDRTLNLETNILLIKDFLAKIENPVIIGVHTEKFPQDKIKKIKNWEFSTVIANKIENCLTSGTDKINSERIKSVGYGEFLPAKNTPYNGGNYRNRVDIMILCNISGE